MPFKNNMTDLVNKLEGRMGLRNVPMPDDYTKDKWATNIIIPDTLETFSRYFQRRIKYHVNDTTPYRDGWYYIDEDILGPNIKLLGILDLDWTSVANRISTAGYGTIDPYAMMSNLDPFAMMTTQLSADYNSLIDTGIYIETQDTNKFRLVSTLNHDMRGFFREFDIFVTISHSPSLMTISPTSMNIFEELAQSDVATYLYTELVHYDDLETAYATLSLKLDTLNNEASKRDNIIEKLENSYVSAANPSMPIFLVQ